MFVLALLGTTACGLEVVDVKPTPKCESFENFTPSDYSYGYESDTFKFNYFYNEEYAYWGGFARSNIKDTDPANGLYANQFAVFNEKAASGDKFLIYYYDEYNDPCDIVIKRDGVYLSDVKLNLSTYTYASITDEDINTFARKFEEGDYLKVVFTAMNGFVESANKVECYVVDFRDGKREMATNWTEFSLTDLGADYDRVRVTIETSDVGEWGANTPLYICLDDLCYFEE